MPKVDSWEIRLLFNRARIWESVQSNDLDLRVIRVGKPAIPMPPGTISVMAGIWDDRTKIAEVHYYQHADGTLGGSGKPDPKTLLVNGTHYWV
jgi:hypothetical protein